MARRLKKYKKQGVEEPLHPKFYHSQKAKPPNPINLKRKYNRMKNNNLTPKPLIKLMLNLLILTGLALLIKHSYQLFATHPRNPLKESIILIIGLALWIAIIKLSKSRSGHYWLRYNWTKPSFKLTTFLTIVIILIFAFAGVKPMSTYKDTLFSQWNEHKITSKIESVVDGITVEVKETAEDFRVAVFPTDEEIRIDIHKLINEERNQIGLSSVSWDDSLARLAQSQANYCAEIGYMEHSNRYAFEGGENLVYTIGSLSASDAVNSWMGSPPHREYLLSARVKRAGVGIASKNGKTFAAWAFSD